MDANRRHVEYYQRADDDTWQAGILPADQTLHIECSYGDQYYQAALSLDAIYEDVRQ